MTNAIKNQTHEYGSVNISEDVIEVIASIAATEIPGVAGMNGGFTGGITDMLGMSNLSKGVKVELGQEELVVSAYIIVEYGENIIEISKKVQENIKKSIETMTGLEVVKVVVNVQGIKIKKDKEKDKKEEENILK